MCTSCICAWQFVHIYEFVHCFCTSATPTLLKLKTMKGADGKPLKIIETVAAGDYVTFGMCLLQDENGEQVGLIERDQIYITEMADKWCTYTYISTLDRVPQTV